MPQKTNQVIGTVAAPPGIEPPWSESSVSTRGGDFERESLGGAATSATCGPQVYRRAADLALRRWVHLIGPTPWLADDCSDTRKLPLFVHNLHRRQGAALGIALLCEQDVARSDRPYLRELVRCSLIQWELSLCGDGCPAGRSHRLHPLHVATASHVVRLLTETVGFRTGVLLSDVERHLRWLSRCRPQTAWLEAALVCALADCAMLVSDSALRRETRRRLADFLSTQSSEGWFPERGGADIGRLSLTVDALARSYIQNEWSELTEPLQRALRFLIHFVHPDGSVGGAYGSCGTSFLSPYGVELLAPHFPEAAALSQVARRQVERSCPERLFGCDDDLYVVLGAAVALAAGSATRDLPNPAPYPHQGRGRTRFGQAGLSIVSTNAYYGVVNGRKAGALRVSWRNGGADLDDPGITVIGTHRTLTSTSGDPRSTEQVTEASVISSGVLRRVGGRSRTRWGRARRLFRRLFQEREVSKAEPSPPDAQPSPHRYHSATRDRFEREVTFEEDRVHIRDRIRCRLPCKTIVCQSPAPTSSETLVDVGVHGGVCRAPVFMEGGRHVEITRVYRDGELCS